MTQLKQHVLHRDCPSTHAPREFKSTHHLQTTQPNPFTPITLLVPNMPERQFSSTRHDPSTTSSVRRNLFHAHLSRRPPTPSTASTMASSTTDTSASTTIQRSPLEGEKGSRYEEAGNADFVVRDQNGEVEVGPLLLGRQDVEEEGVEASTFLIS